MALPLLKLALLILFSILPGSIAAKRVKADPLTQLSLSVLISWFSFYILQFTGYLLSLPQWLLFAGILAVSGMAARELLRDKTALHWRGLQVWTALTVWILFLQSYIVVYGGTLWFGDWYEHYERSIFFLSHGPSDTRFLMGFWSLPARGPLFNTVAAFFLSMVGQDFWDFQIAATVLNSVAIIPMALLLRDLGQINERIALLLALVVFALAPFAVQQETFTWTKFLSLAFLLQAFHMYILGLRNNNESYLAISMLLFAAGVLAHYLVLIFWVFFAFHYLWHIMKNRSAIRIFLSTVLLCSIVLASWFTYAFYRFGLKETFTANSTFGVYTHAKSGSRRPARSWAESFAGNLVNTAIPFGWRHNFTGLGHSERILLADPRFPGPEKKSRAIEWLADLANAPSSLTGALGFAGVLAVFMTIPLGIKRGVAFVSPPPGRLFWGIFLLGGIPLNILASRDYAPEGVTALNLFPYVCLIWVFIVGQLKRYPRLALLISAVFIAESLVGTGALLFLEGRTVPIVVTAEGTLRATAPVHLNSIYVSNYLYKLQEGAIFLLDYLNLQKVIFRIVSLFVVAVLIYTSNPARERAKAAQV
jgi:hypothetical protein